MVALTFNAPQFKQVKEQASKYFEQEELPEEFRWIEYLSSLHLRLFTIDLKEALDLVRKDKGQRLAEVIESWQATAEIDADPSLRQRLHATRDEKRYTPWEPASSPKSGK